MCAMRRGVLLTLASRRRHPASTSEIFGARARVLAMLLVSSVLLQLPPSWIANATDGTENTASTKPNRDPDPFDLPRETGPFRKALHTFAPEPGGYAYDDLHAADTQARTVQRPSRIAAARGVEEHEQVTTAQIKVGRRHAAAENSGTEQITSEAVDRRSTLNSGAPPSVPAAATTGSVQPEDPPRDRSLTNTTASKPTEHCKKLLQYSTTWVKCDVSDRLPRKVFEMLHKLSPSECSQIDWLVREMLLLLSEDVAAALDAVDTRLQPYFPSGKELILSGDTSVLFLMDCLRSRFYAAGVDGRHISRIDTYEKAGREREELYGKKPTISFAEEDVDASSGDEGHLPNNIRSGHLGTPVVLDPSSPASGMSTEDIPNRKAKSKESFQIEYHGDTTAKETLEYYLDKTLEEKEAKNLPRITVEQCQNCQVLEDRKAGLQLKAAIVYVVLNLNNNGPIILKDLLLALHCADKHLKFPDSYDILVLYHGFKRNRDQSELDLPIELRWLSDNAPVRIQRKMQFVQLPDDQVLEGDGVNGKYGCRCPAWAPRCWDVNWMRATRIFTDHMFDYLPADKYEFFMRLDSDFFFINTPEFDAVKMLHENNCAFAYHRLSIEAPGCFDEFQEYVEDFSRRYPLPPGMTNQFGEPEPVSETAQKSGKNSRTNIRMGHGVAAAGGQWTVGDVRLFSSPIYRRFAKEAREKIFEHRWADQLLFAAGTILFGNKQFCFHDMFQDAGLFVHKKQGYTDESIWEKCKPAPVDIDEDQHVVPSSTAESAFNWTAMLESYPTIDEEREADLDSMPDVQDAREQDREDL
ncbi:unnamed protein product [Amoebophrya sp. A120]|nr:unnamed protein product [Amoebophrya sp. A120]|eukprot:GSA120T00021249001.1